MRATQVVTDSFARADARLMGGSNKSRHDDLDIEHA
jgi:hypothetical protein